MKKLFYLAAVALVAGMASCGGEKAAEEAQDTVAAPVEEVEAVEAVEAVDTLTGDTLVAVEGEAVEAPVAE